MKRFKSPMFVPVRIGTAGSGPEVAMSNILAFPTDKARCRRAGADCRLPGDRSAAVILLFTGVRHSRKCARDLPPEPDRPHKDNAKR